LIMKNVLPRSVRGLLLMAASFFAAAGLCAQNLTSQFSVSSDWGSGFTADVVLTNNTGATIQNWQLQITLAGQITDLWNGAVLGNAGGVYTVGPAAVRAIPPSPAPTSK
jgi:cellulase/cellobiase CelA1